MTVHSKFSSDGQKPSSSTYEEPISINQQAVCGHDRTLEVQQARAETFQLNL
jgi:hypothetical protein